MVANNKSKKLKRVLSKIEYTDYKVYKWLVIFIAMIETGNIQCIFYTGRTDQSINEMDRLNGRMTPRQAAVKCELDDECAGFTYHGPKTLLDGHIFHITFYK